VKHKEGNAIILAALKQQGVFLSKQQKEKLEEYVALVKEWNTKIHLVSKGDQNFIEERHILPSFLFYVELQKLTPKSKPAIVDLGSGAGFPGVVLAIMLTEARIVLVESSRKKALFLKKVCQELALNCEIENARFEEWVERKTGLIDVVVARAVASLETLFVLTKPLLQKEKTILLTIKSCSQNEKISEQLKRETKIEVLKNRFFEISDYMKDKCILKMEYVHG
jgi:16S rRNA (guanine527-N7)-methyltransferase